MNHYKDNTEGIRNLTLRAYVCSGVGKHKQTAYESTVVEGATVNTIKKIIQDYENELCKKYGDLWDYDEDEIYCDIQDELGWTGNRAEYHTNNNTGLEAEDDLYSIGYK